ncbi:MAG: NTP transferase domain-containing protein [Candidatus Methanosuratus sp.]|nr:NTP transferase domain-containing protein [Candidatus Methanosuratincola sp.]
MVFLITCDMPFLDPHLPSVLASRIGDHGAAVPAWQNGYIEPLAAPLDLATARGTGAQQHA